MRYEVWGMRYEVWGMRHDEACLFCFSRPRMTWLRVCVVPLRLWNSFGSPGINSIGQWTGLPYSMIQIHRHRLVCYIFIGLFGDSKVIDTQDTGGGTYVFWMHWKLPNIHGYATFSNYFLVEARLKKNEESKSSYFNKHQRGQRQQAS